MKKHIEKILDSVLMQNESFRRYINYRYDFALPGIIPSNGCFWKDALKFKFAPSLISDTDWEGYRFDIIKPNHNILDIGSTGGGYAMKAAELANHVYAVEPLFADVLRENIALNGFTNITVLEGALGFGGIRELEYACSVFKTKKQVRFNTLEALKMMCGCNIDILKLDAEGGEWSILEKELAGIQYIDAEIHSFDDMPRPEKFLQLLYWAGFKYTTKVLNSEQTILYAERS